MVEYFVNTVPQNEYVSESSFHNETSRQKRALDKFFAQKHAQGEDFLTFFEKEQITKENLHSHGDKIFDLIDKELSQKNFATIKKIFDLNYPNNSTQKNILNLYIVKNKLPTKSIDEMEEIFGTISIPPSYRAFLAK